MHTSSSKSAVINIPHHESESSAAKLLESLGYSVKGSGPELKSKLTKLIRHPQRIRTILKEKATFSDFENCNVYLTTRPGYATALMESMPHMKDRIIWYEIISGPPGVKAKTKHKQRPLHVPCRYMGANKKYADSSSYDVSGPRYVLWPPIVDPSRYLNTQRPTDGYNTPICLVNNVKNWGHGRIVEPLSKQDVRFYGSFNKDVSNNPGFINPKQVPETIAKALCYTHLKSKDCPGYSLYQALMCACPVVLSSLFLRNTDYYDLYIDEETCLVAKDDENLDKEDRAQHLFQEYMRCIKQLSDPKENKRIGLAGRQRLMELMWNETRDEDIQSLRKFING